MQHHPRFAAGSKPLVGNLKVGWRIAFQRGEGSRRVVELLSESPGLRPEDIFINLLQVPAENWSVGLGESQFAPSDVPALA